MPQNDDWWKALAVHLAAMEQLFQAWDSATDIPRLDVDKLLLRARYLYEEGSLADLAHWHAAEPGPTPPLPASLVTPPTLEMKRCVCGEDVKVTLRLHKYKQDGTACGHNFSRTV